MNLRNCLAIHWEMATRLLKNLFEAKAFDILFFKLIAIK